MAHKLDLTGLTPEYALVLLNALPEHEDRADVILHFGIAFATPALEALSRGITHIGTWTIQSEADLPPRRRELRAVIAEYDEGKRRRAELRRPKSKGIGLIKQPWWGDGEFDDGPNEKPSV